MDIRRRMLFKKKASSSGGGGGSTTGGSYTVDLNGQWEATTAVPNPDSTLYDGVYRSSSNYNVNNGVAIMYITIKDCSSFKMYIRSYAESNYDYVMVSQLDKTINGNTTYSDATLVKAHTRGNQQSGTTLSSYTLVEFTGITSGEHTITVVYRKDSSVNNGDDRGYVLIEKSQAGSGDGGGDEGESNEGPINIDNYLTIEAIENGLTASLSTNACEYCVDGDGNWKSLAAGTATESINTGHTLSFRGELTPTRSVGIGTFTISKKCNLKGNCMSMLFGDNAANNYSLSGKNNAFDDLFRNCANIVTVSSNFLPATTLANYCYSGMFQNCTSLTTAPKLPAITLVTNGYGSMFQGCTSLTTAPKLPATTLASGCYRYMFYGCTNLTTAPALSATTLASNCYSMMFYGCTSLTTTPTVLPATTLVDSCYQSMFYGCTSLTTAPELPAATLVTWCYSGMFQNCTKLNYIKMLATDISASACLDYWVKGVASTGTFVKNKNATWNKTGQSGIPEGWTVVNDGEESGGNLITFTVNSTEYQAEEGMTWEEWINSSYYDQNLNITIKTNGSLYIDGDPILLNSLQGVLVQYTTTEIIIDGTYNSM